MDDLAIKIRRKSETGMEPRAIGVLAKYFTPKLYH